MKSSLMTVVAWSFGGLLLVVALCWTAVNALVMWITRD